MGMGPREDPWPAQALPGCPGCWGEKHPLFWAGISSEHLSSRAPSGPRTPSRSALELPQHESTLLLIHCFHYPSREVRWTRERPFYRWGIRGSER